MDKLMRKYSIFDLAGRFVCNEMKYESGTSRIVAHIFNIVG